MKNVFLVNFSLSFNVTFNVTEKSNNAEYMESPSDESSACSPANSVCVESEKQAGADGEPLKRNTPEEVCLLESVRFLIQTQF